MSHRRVTDERGRVWEVWDVIPTAVERRLLRAESLPRVPERRTRQEPRLLVPDELRSGWLAFESVDEKKRLAPLPPEWTQLDDSDILSLLKRAKSLGRPKRLVQ